MFPDLDPAERDEIFNRYAELFIIPENQPKLEGNGVVGLSAERDSRTWPRCPIREG